MEKIFAKLRDAGGTFIVGTVQFVGKLPLEILETPAVSAALRAGALVKLTEAEYNEDLKKFNEEQDYYKSIEAKAKEMGTTNLELAKAVIDGAMTAANGEVIPPGTKIEEIAIADMDVPTLKAALAQNFPDIEIPKGAKKPDLAKLLTELTEAAELKDAENGGTGAGTGEPK